MPEEAADKPANKPSVSSRTGLTTPFPEGKLPEGVDEETRLFHGIDPETNERVTVTLEGLKAEFGTKAGEKKYLAIAGIAGGSVFFNPNVEASSFRPPLGISGLSTPLDELQERLGQEEGKEKFESNKKHAETVKAILDAKE